MCLRITKIFLTCSSSWILLRTSWSRRLIWRWIPGIQTTEESRRGWSRSHRCRWSPRGRRGSLSRWDRTSACPRRRCCLQHRAWWGWTWCHKQSRQVWCRWWGPGWGDTDHQGSWESWCFLSDPCNTEIILDRSWNNFVHIVKYFWRFLPEHILKELVKELHCRWSEWPGCSRCSWSWWCWSRGWQSWSCCCHLLQCEDRDEAQRSRLDTDGYLMK